MMRCRARLWSILGLLGALASPAAAGGAAPWGELKWMPSGAAAAFGFERRTAAADLWRAFQAELAFGVDLKEGLGELGLLTTAPEVKRLVAGVWKEPSGAAVLAVVRLRSPKLPESMPGAESCRAPRALCRIRSPGSRDLGWARIEDALLVAGDAALVERSLAMPSPRDGILKDPLGRLLPSPSPQAWAVQLAPWFRPEAAGASPPVRRVPTVGGTLTRIVRAGYSATVAHDIRFSMWLSAASAADAALLADALRAFLDESLAGAGGPPEVKRVLEEATVKQQEATLSLTLGISAAAMAQIHQNAVSRSLLSWRLGVVGRERQQRIDDILDALAIGEGGRVADVGAGEGFFTVLLARAVGPRGRVQAVEIAEPALAALERRVRRSSLSQVEVIRGAADDPRLPREGLDAALIVNSYHEMPEHDRMLEHIRDALRPGGRLVLVEPFQPARRAEPRGAQEKAHLLAPELVEEDIRRVGLELVSRDDHFIIKEGGGDSLDWIIVARRPGGY